MELNVFDCVSIDPGVTRGINFSIVSDRDWSRKEYHQSILNAYYNLWREGKFDRYSDMVAAAASRNPLHAFAILIGKCNQQICNGGAIQYFDNNYASIGRVDRFENSDDMEIGLHEDMLTLWGRFLKPYHTKYPFLKKVYSLLDSFVVYQADYDDRHEECPDCDGEGYYVYCGCCDELIEECDCGEDCDHDEIKDIKKDCEECFECEEYRSDFYGRYVVETSQTLVEVEFNDDEYYKYSEQLEEFLNQFFYEGLYWELLRPGHKSIA